MLIFLVHDRLSPISSFLKLSFKVCWHDSEFRKQAQTTILLPPCFTDGIRFFCWNAVFSFFYRWCSKVKPTQFCNRLIHLQSTAQTAVCFLYIMCGERAPTLHSDDTLMNINMGSDNHTLIDLWPARKKRAHSHLIAIPLNKKHLISSSSNLRLILHTLSPPPTDKYYWVIFWK